MDTSKIIIGTVGGGRYTVTASIVKAVFSIHTDAHQYTLLIETESLDMGDNSFVAPIDFSIPLTSTTHPVPSGLPMI